MRMLLLGDWNNPKPAPHTTSRQMIAPSVGWSGSRASNNSPAAMTVSPTPPNTPAWTRSTSSPATGATTTITAGHAVSRSPVWTSL